MDDKYLDTPIWGVAAIAKVINRSPRATNHLLAKKLLDADKIGWRFVTTPRRLLKRIRGEAAAEREVA